MTRTICGCADLLRIRNEDKTLLAVAAELMGFDPNVLDVETKTSDESDLVFHEADLDTQIIGTATPVVSVPESSNQWPDNADNAVFWRLNRYWLNPPVSEVTEPVKEAAERSWKDANGGPVFHPIARWREVLPRLRKELLGQNRGNRIDVDRVVQRLARAEQLEKVPRQLVRRWGSRIQLIVDESQHLIPFHIDQLQFQDHISHIYGEQNVELVHYDESSVRLRVCYADGDTADYQYPDATVPIIVLSDFGALLDNASERSEFWIRWASDNCDRGSNVLAIVPCDPHRISNGIRSLIRVMSWQTPNHYQGYDHPDRRRECVDRLLVALSPTSAIEPGLLRAIRSEVLEFSDASLESDFWRSAHLITRHPSAGLIGPDIAKDKLFPSFVKLDNDVRKGVLSVIRQWRHARSDEVWIGEIWKLDEKSRALIPENDLKIADERLAALSAHIMKDPTRLNLHERAWVSRLTEAMPETTLENSKPLRDLFRSSHPELKNVFVHGSDLSEVKRADGKRQTYWLSQRGKRFVFSKAHENSVIQGGIIATLESTSDWITIEIVKQTFWKSGKSPKWASGWGRDEYGAWVEFTIDAVQDEAGPSTATITQRMRWIRPGTFQMGSPETEAGRYSDEGPQHEVTLTRGFWMFDTPVTQELWRAVMGNDPSHFQGDRLPVEKVSWDDAQRFLGRLNARLAEAVFVLPTEAQWEHACRAGTQTAYSFGNDPKTLEDYAWYTENSSSTTHPVATRKCNPWGLFDVHGNVWECCQDFWSGDYSAAGNVDPTGPEKGRYRVLRGGSWYYFAQYARSACRFINAPGDRYNFIGFRCAQVQGAAEPTEEDGEAAEQRARPTKGGVAVELPVSSVEIFSQIPIPASPILIVRSDMETLELHRLAKPEWASAIGRDRFGLWAEFTFNAEVAVQQQLKSGKSSSKRKKTKVEPTPATTQFSVVQRMRWIPPGRFWMGSSESDDLASDDEKPQHEVILSHGYWLFDTPVTQELWLAVMNTNPSYFSEETNARRPVERVSWEECQSFIATINRSHVGKAGLNLTLPTEAEWEYACRAGTTTRYSFGDEISPQLVNYRHEETKTNETSDVATFPANPWGLFDMHGNVWEWCFDWYDGKYYKASSLKDPIGPKGGHYRVLRGGCWFNTAQDARSAYRDYFEPGNRNYFIGFRCAQVHCSIGAVREETERVNERRDEQGADATPPDRSE